MDRKRRLLLLGAVASVASAGLGTPIYLGETVFASGTNATTNTVATAAPGGTLIVRGANGNFGRISVVEIGGVDVSASCTFVYTSVVANRLSAAFCHVAAGIASGTAVKITFDNGGSSQFDLSYCEGVASVSPLDVQGSTVTAAASTSINYGVTPTYGGQSLVCTLVKATGGQANNVTFDGQLSPNNSVNGISGGNVGKLSTGFEIVTGTAAQSYTDGINVARDLMAFAFNLKAA